MDEDSTFYIKLFFLSLKNKQLRGLLRYRWNSFTEKWKKKRIQECISKAISIEEAREKIFKNKIVDPKVFSELEKHIDSFVQMKKGLKWPSRENPYPIDYGLPKSLCRFLFNLCIFSNSEKIIEAGVANGFSSSYILLALDYANSGKLISIDSIMLPWQTREKIGQVIPSNLKKRHALVVGNSLDELEKFSKEYFKIDIFMHDSEHTYTHMIKEYSIAWTMIKNEGFLLSDDVAINDAFLDFAGRINRTPIIIEEENGHYFGMIQK